MTDEIRNFLHSLSKLLDPESDILEQILKDFEKASDAEKMSIRTMVYNLRMMVYTKIKDYGLFGRLEQLLKIIDDKLKQ